MEKEKEEKEREEENGIIQRFVACCSSTVGLLFSIGEYRVEDGQKKTAEKSAQKMFATRRTSTLKVSQRW